MTTNDNYIYWRYRFLSSNLPRGWTAVALMQGGLLARHQKTYTYGIWMGYYFRSCNSRAALNAERECQ
jgi:hypothetical protein